MFESEKQIALNKYKNIIGDTKETIEAIQKFINNFSSKGNSNIAEVEDDPAASINRVLKAAACEDTQKDIADFLKKI